MELVRGNFIISNGQKKAFSSFKFPEASVAQLYEVLKVQQGKALFEKEHIARLEKSCKVSGYAFPGQDVISEYIKLAIQENQFELGNIKVIVYHIDKKIQCATYFIQHKYPTEEEREKGIVCKTFAFERPDPNIKRWNEIFRKNVNRFIRKEKIYEAILVNNEGCITEGSRSNVFFVDGGGTFYTAPTEHVLPGITRTKILNICEKLGLQVEFKKVSLKDLTKMKACFISGTSPGLLSVRKLDEIEYDVREEVVCKVREEFEKG